MNVVNYEYRRDTGLFSQFLGLGIGLGFGSLSKSG